MSLSHSLCWPQCTLTHITHIQKQAYYQHCLCCKSVSVYNIKWLLQTAVIGTSINMLLSLLAMEWTCYLLQMFSFVVVLEMSNNWNKTNTKTYLWSNLLNRYTKGYEVFLHLRPCTDSYNLNVLSWRCPFFKPWLSHPFQNVKLLQQFISPHTGMVYDPTRTGKKSSHTEYWNATWLVEFDAVYGVLLSTGVCMKQQKKLNEAIHTAQNHGTTQNNI